MGDLQVMIKTTPTGIVLAGASDDDGCYDADKLREILGWTKRQMARYLDRSPSALSRPNTGRAYQHRLARLAAMLVELFELMGDDLPLIRLWLRTPTRALDGSSPTDRILSNQIEVVQALLDEYKSGLAL